MCVFKWKVRVPNGTAVRTVRIPVWGGRIHKSASLPPIDNRLLSPRSIVSSSRTKEEDIIGEFGGSGANESESGGECANQSARDSHRFLPPPKQAREAARGRVWWLYLTTSETPKSPRNLRPVLPPAATHEPVTTNRRGGRSACALRSLRNSRAESDLRSAPRSISRAIAFFLTGALAIAGFVFFIFGGQPAVGRREDRVRRSRQCAIKSFPDANREAPLHSAV